MSLIPIGQPWEMIVVDVRVLEVPVSNQNNRYFLVIQDYTSLSEGRSPNAGPDRSANQQHNSLYIRIAHYSSLQLGT